MKRPVAIIGMGESAQLVPWENQGIDFWVLAHDPMAVRAHRAFEMHDAALVAKGIAEYGGVEYVKGLMKLAEDVPVMTQENYPLDDVAGLVGDYFGSSIAYMLALAIYEGRRSISLFGIDLTKEKYDHQRSNLEYLIGFARGRGIPVVNCCDGDLLKHKQAEHWNRYGVIFPDRYGYVAQEREQ